MMDTTVDTKIICNLSDTDEYYSCDSDMENDDHQLSADAVHTREPARVLKSISTICSNDIELIDTKLALYEKISLIYLLYEDPHIALQHIILLLQNAQIKVIDEWYCHEKKSANWVNKLLEALTIIQNYEILIMLGFVKQDMILRYLPLREGSLEINLVRKNCYRLCEDFTILQRDQFLINVEKDFESKHMQYITEDDKNLYRAEYLEMYFLYFETVRYISLKDVSKLAKIFKQMDLVNLYEKFDRLHGKVCENYNVDRTPNALSGSASISNEMVISNDLDDNNLEGADCVYNLDSKYPGLLLIINNEDFYTEYREEYSNMLPNVNLKLESRIGSEVDRDKLETTFQKLGFEVSTVKNKKHDDMLQILKDIVKEFQHSSLFVAILSHGDQGIVYGANSIAVQVTDIQKMICDKQLSGIPKVLLLQSCQGNDCQRLNDDEEYEIDAPKKFTPPKTTDLLTFRATISGYSAVRHRKNGTWFIQTFCEAVEKYPKDDIQEICTKVIAEVSKKKWGEKCMVPLVETTFTKKLYLISKK